MNIFKALTTGVVAVALGTTVFGADNDTMNFDISVATINELNLTATSAISLAINSGVAGAFPAGVIDDSADLQFSTNAGTDSKKITLVLDEPTSLGDLVVWLGDGVAPSGSTCTHVDTGTALTLTTTAQDFITAIDSGSYTEDLSFSYQGVQFADGTGSQTGITLTATLTDS